MNQISSVYSIQYSLQSLEAQSTFPEACTRQTLRSCKLHILEEQLNGKHFKAPILLSTRIRKSFADGRWMKLERTLALMGCSLSHAACACAWQRLSNQRSPAAEPCWFARWVWELADAEKSSVVCGCPGWKGCMKPRHCMCPALLTQDSNWLRQCPSELQSQITSASYHSSTSSKNQKEKPNYL